MEVKQLGGQLLVRGGPTTGIDSPEWAYVSSAYGPRTPFVITLPNGQQYTTASFHYGNDIPAPVGTPIWNVGPEGKIVGARFWDDGGSAGIWALLQHADGWQTAYYHMNGPLPPIGSTVPRGGIVGIVGNTGVSTGPHLHWEVRRNTSRLDSLGAQAIAWINAAAPPAEFQLPLGIRALAQGYGIAIAEQHSTDEYRYVLTKPRGG